MSKPTAAALAASEAENAELRLKLEQAAAAQGALSGRLSQVSSHGRLPSGELMVGIRSIADNTLGLKSPIPNEQDVQLHGDTQVGNPGCVAVISYAWWQQLRRDPHFMETGLILRDDSILGDTAIAGPADRPQDLAPGWAINAVPDPVKFVYDQPEAEVRRRLEAMTSPHSLLRVRRVVDVKLRELQAAEDPADPRRAEKALMKLPALLQMIDQVTTMKLEWNENDVESVRNAR